MHVPRTSAFVLVASDHGTMIVNRFDYHATRRGTCGVGHQILERSFYERHEIVLALQLLQLRRQCSGDGIVAVDCGANIGVHTVEWSKAMYGWGSVIAIEPQERIFYALAGNIAINNCLNATAMLAAVSCASGGIRMPHINYAAPASFGSLELRHGPENEYIGQDLDYSSEITVPAVTIDSLALPRVDFIKMDIEGMEIEALEGSADTLSRDKPTLIIESLKIDRQELAELLTSNGYEFFDTAMNTVAMHTSQVASLGIGEFAMSALSTIGRKD